MADYYPLLAKAVAGLPDSTEEARRAIYERARKALLAQLRKIEPPIGESDIARENGALDESIARLESEIAGKKAAETAGAPAPAAPPRPPEKPAPSEKPTPAHPPTGDRAAAPPPKFAPPRAPNSPAAPPKPFSFRPPNPNDPARAQEAPEEQAARPPQGEAPEAMELKPPRPRENTRPAAPAPAAGGAARARPWIVGGVVGAIVLAVGATAYFMRDQNPQGLARLGQTSSPPPAEAPANGKISDRADNSAAPPASASQPSAQTQAAPQAVPLPVAGRAALLIGAAGQADKIDNTYVGSVVWRLDSVPTGAGRPLGTAVHADVDIPDAKLRMSIDIQKNFDESLPASHTINVGFTILPGSSITGVKQIGALQMRREDASNGDPLAGVPVQITENLYLIGLVQGDLGARNMDLLKNRAWVDLPVALTDGRIAKFTLEKGASGDRVISDAIAAWSQDK